MAQGNGTAASEAASVVASTGNSLLQHMNFRGHEAEAVNQEQPEHILGKTFRFYLRLVDFYSFKLVLNKNEEKIHFNQDTK